MTTTAQEIAEGTVDSIINLHAANPNRSREWLAEAVGLREAVEKGEALLNAALDVLTAPKHEYAERGTALRIAATEYDSALAKLKGEKA